MAEDHDTSPEGLQKLVGTEVQAYVTSLRPGLEPSGFPKLCDPEDEVNKTIAAIRKVLEKPRVIFSIVPLDEDPYNRVEFKTPSMEDLLRIPLWARVAFAARCAQRVLSLMVVPGDEKRAEVHYSAVEQAVAFASECAEVGSVVSLPPFQNIPLHGNDDPVITACVCGALVPFGAADADTAAMAAMAADYANWAGWWHHGGSTHTEGYEFAAKTNNGIWSDFGRLHEAAHRHGWTNHTPIPAEFFVVNAESRRPVVFLCHAKEDTGKAKELFRRLRATGMQPWLDKYNLVLG
jgi:hypothetical protein